MAIPRAFRNEVKGFKRLASEEENCFVCKRRIRGKPSLVKLQITHADSNFLEKAKDLGFKSKTWSPGDYMQGRVHGACFKTVARVWQVAFNTRSLSPRR